MSEQMTSWILKAALDYAEAGYAVMPVKRSDKAPYTPHGLKDASKDPDTIRGWWKQWPEANVAIACGSVSNNIVVIDVDNKPGKNGLLSIAIWQSEHGDFPETVVAHTGSGGKHYYFHVQDPKAFKNRVDAIPAVDIRGDGAYVVAYPSEHENGKMYTWRHGVSIIDTDEIAEANESVLELLNMNSRESAAQKQHTAAKKQQVKNVKSGNRNDTVFRYAASQCGLDVPIEVCMTAVRELNKDFEPPLDDHELEKTVRSAYSYEPNEKTIYGKVEPDPEPDELELQTLDEFEERDVDWLIRGYIPKEQITLLCGTGGTGKTSVWISLVAALSTGSRTLFDGTVDDAFLPKREPQKILFFSGEDTIEHVIKKRLHAQRADMSNIMTVSIDDSRFDKVRFGSKYLGKLIEKYRPALCVFDPLQSFLPIGVKMSERNAMRQTMRCLIEWGKKYGTTFLIVMHTNKLLNVWGRNRMADSADLWDIARCVLMVGDTEDTNIKYVSHEKSNYGMTRDTLLFKNENGNPTFHAWTKSKDRDFVMSQTKARNASGPSSSSEEAKDLIMSELEDHPDGVAVNELTDMLKEIGFKDWAIQRAKSELKKDKKIAYSRKGMNGEWIAKKVRTP
jgi:RecA-family ATPase